MMSLMKTTGTKEPGFDNHIEVSDFFYLPPNISTSFKNGKPATGNSRFADLSCRVYLNYRDRSVGVFLG